LLLSSAQSDDGKRAKKVRISNRFIGRSPRTTREPGRSTTPPAHQD
jgi:hypothetical protein